MSDSRKTAFNNAISDIYAPVSSNPATVRGRELAALVLERLGRPLSVPTFQRLSEIQQQLQETQAALAQRKADGNVSPEEYLEGVNEALAFAMRQSKQVLGRGDFLTIFGEAGGHPEGLIDRETFLKEENQHK